MGLNQTGFVSPTNQRFSGVKMGIISSMEGKISFLSQNQAGCIGSANFSPTLPENLVLHVIFEIPMRPGSAYFG